MPLYEFQCEACAHRFEVIQKFSDPPPAACPKCGGAVQKLLSSPAIQFKGSGFYLTDYGRGTSSKSENANTKADKADSGTTAGSEGGSKSDGKSDGKSGSKSDSAPGAASKASTSDTPSAKSTPAKSE